MGPTGNGSGNGKAVTSVLNAAQSAQRREDIRLTKMMLTIFLCFLVCFLPLMLVNVADDAVEFPFLHILASVLAWASAVVNPFIYAFKNRQYQQAFIKVSFAKKKKKIYLHFLQFICSVASYVIFKYVELASLVLCMLISFWRKIFQQFILELVDDLDFVFNVLFISCIEIIFGFNY